MNATAGPRLCIALPTRNRCELATQALESVLPQLQDGDELVVVDSASDDGTGARIGELLAGREHAARVIFEPLGGVSRARNLALADTDAPIVCFFDDDELVDSHWVENLRAAWRGAPADVAVIGGPIRPQWDTRRPNWLRDDMLYVLSLLDLGPDRLELDQEPRVGYVWGGNMTVRRAAALSVGGFDELLGVSPAAPLGRGEEEDFQRRLASSGWQVWYEPSTVVHHQLPTARTTPQYFRRAFREAARGAANRGMSRRIASVRLASSLARLAAALLRLRRDEVTRTSFGVAYAWTLLTSRRVRWNTLQRSSEG